MNVIKAVRKRQASCWESSKEEKGGAEKASRKIRRLVEALENGWDGTGQGD